MFAFAFDLAKRSVRREGPAGRTGVATEEARTQDGMREGRGEGGQEEDWGDLLFSPQTESRQYQVSSNER